MSYWNKFIIVGSTYWTDIGTIIFYMNMLPHFVIDICKNRDELVAWFKSHLFWNKIIILICYSFLLYCNVL